MNESLLIGFAIAGSREDGAPATPNPRMELGDIALGAAVTAVWIML